MSEEKKTTEEKTTEKTETKETKPGEPDKSDLVIKPVIPLEGTEHKAFSV